MKFNRSAAYKRLQKKLLALRATLPTDERQVLDELIGPEVEAHRLNSKFAQKTVSKANSKTNSKNQEVEAHRFNQRTVQRTASKADPKKSDA
jgi:Fe-S cluster assembly scaffold protein SufB